MSSRPPRSEADVHFMSGMIPHHAQAVLIAGWAASHGARADVRILSERIVVGQRDEIGLMQYWLRERGEVVPAANASTNDITVIGFTNGGNNDDLEASPHWVFSTATVYSGTVYTDEGTTPITSGPTVKVATASGCACKAATSLLMWPPR